MEIYEISETEFYIDKCRDYWTDFAERKGRSFRFCVVTFGCQMNERDSEKLCGILSKMGGVATTEERQADLILYNTCTVRENADKRVFGRLGVLKSIKEENPDLLICLCGCMMQEETVIEKLRKSYSFVDLIFGTHNLYEFAPLLWTRLDSGCQIIQIWKEAREIVEDLPVKRKYAFKSGVNIMYGCDNFCSYCIVPYVRGRERSRNPKDIIREIEALAADGVKEVMLLGQNVNSYGKGLTPAVDFSELISEVEKVDGIERIRFMSSHPKDLSDKLISVMASSKKICRHVHLALQSGSSRLLERMNRHYSKEDFLSLVDRMRTAMPDLAVTTDIIVGFPGETREDVDHTIDVIEKARFDGAFTFVYSKRTGTPAASMPDQVSEDFVKVEFDRVLQTVQRVASDQAKRFTGQVVPVLVEGVNEKDSSMVTGRMSQNHSVHFPGSPDLIGQIVNVHLDQCLGFYYIGSRA
ncbi:MAG: tRNA (N6-isopentenyl adenosine(37)-C2)-methylthiotransferase MiaB [Lachnospiraceae bacterium]|nr:tRNA (N6-isopentenyl adenosine(37)-C2)-methylthiotransferase MiaB [Lachnospiraceae bacterium]